MKFGLSDTVIKELQDVFRRQVHSRNRPYCVHYCVILSRHYRGFSMTLEGFSVRVEGIDLQDAVADRA